MVKSFILIDSFTTGQISPKLRGRVDLDQYNNGVRTLKNFTIHPHGGITRRTGTQYIAEVKDSSKEVRLVPFQFSTTQAYVLELGDEYMRFYRNRGQILDTNDITNGDFSSDISEWTDRSTGTGASAWSSGAAELTAAGSGNEARLYQAVHVGISQYTLTVTTSNTLNYRIGTTVGGTEIDSGTVNGTSQTINFTPTNAGTIYIEFENNNTDARTFDDVSLSQPIYEIDTPWSTSDIKELQFAQSADVMYFVHKDYAPRVLTRSNNDEWDLSIVEFEDGPYYDITDKLYGGEGSGISIGTSGTSGSVTVTASSDLFKSTDVGRLIRYRAGTSDEWGWMKITAYSSATQVTASVEKTLSGTTSNDQWRLGAWSDTTGWPQAITFHEQRLCFAASIDQPQTLWGSTAGNIENFSPDNQDFKDEVDDDTSYTFTIASTEANVIHWMSSRRSLFLGTSGNIFVAEASSNLEAITPSNITIRPGVGVDCKKAQALTTQNATLFIHFFGKKLMELGFFFEEDSFRATDLTILAENITSAGIKYMDKQEEPDNIIWAVTDDGKLIGLTYMRAQKVVGWHSHSIGGADVEVESLASIPGTTQTEVWLSIKRTINGNTKRYIEVLTDAFSGNKSDMWFVDSGLSFTSTDSATITGITKASPAVVTTSSPHGFSNGDSLKITGVVGMTEVNNRTFVINNVTTNTFELKNINSSSFTTYASGGTALKLPKTISGLDHLEGETVSLIVNESTHPDVVVSGGSIVLDRGAESATIGLGYESVMESNALEIRSGLGTIQGSIGRIYKVALRFHETLGGKFGYDSENLDLILFRDGDDLMDSSPGIFTGDKILEFPSGYHTQQRVYVKQDQPLPMTLLSFVAKSTTSSA